MKMEQLIGIGTLLVIIGFAIIFIGALSSKDSNTKVAVGGFIGFIPFGFGNALPIDRHLSVYSFFSRAFIGFP